MITHENGKPEIKLNPGLIQFDQIWVVVNCTLKSSVLPPHSRLQYQKWLRIELVQGASSSFPFSLLA